MDLKQQLVVWKKADFLLKNAPVTQEMLICLVEADVLTADMMKHIQSQTYNVERTLMMLSYLGTHGKDVYKKFVNMLVETKHTAVARELRKTEKYTYFGEMLPPAFTYFLDMSAFLRKYPHVAIRLGEDEKHLVQTYIEGKIEVEARKTVEKIQNLENEGNNLRQTIVDLKTLIKNHEKKQRSLERHLEKSKERLDNLNASIKDLENLNAECNSEVRKYKHFRHQQEELDAFLEGKAQELGVKDELIPPSLQLSRMKSLMQTDKRKSSSIRLKLLAAQVHLGVNKLYYAQPHIHQLEALEKRLASLVSDPSVDRDSANDMKKVLAETKQERTLLVKQFAEEEREIYWKQKEVEKLRRDIFETPDTPFVLQGGGGEHLSLKTKIGELLEHVSRLHADDLRDNELKHEKATNDLLQHIQQLNARHRDDLEAVRYKMRCKMHELHRRETLHRRLKGQMNVITRYHAKNMNATQSVEQCRKVVRGIIGEVRKLRKTVEIDAEKMAMERSQKAPPTQKQIEEQERRKAQEEEEKKKNAKKRKKKKKKPEYLKNERLMFISDRVRGAWRKLGVLLGMSQNRMDMVELEIPGGADKFGPDSLCLAMLKAWRDVEKGKVEELVEALLKLERKDLAMVMLPLEMIEIVAAKVKEEELALTSAVNDEDLTVEDFDDDLADDDDGDDGGNADGDGDGYDDANLDLDDDGDNFMKDVPRLPEIIFASK